MKTLSRFENQWGKLYVLSEEKRRKRRLSIALQCIFIICLSTLCDDFATNLSRCWNTDYKPKTSHLLANTTQIDPFLAFRKKKKDPFYLWKIAWLESTTVWLQQWAPSNGSKAYMIIKRPHLVPIFLLSWLGTCVHGCMSSNPL